MHFMKRDHKSQCMYLRKGPTWPGLQILKRAKNNSLSLKFKQTSVVVFKIGQVRPTYFQIRMHRLTVPFLEAHHIYRNMKEYVEIMKEYIMKKDVENMKEYALPHDSENWKNSELTSSKALGLGKNSSLHYVFVYRLWDLKIFRAFPLYLGSGTESFPSL